MAERVSVVVTVLNEAASIGRLLRSFAAQTRPPDEVIIVDGGSRDGTLAALSTFAETAPLPVPVWCGRGRISRTGATWPSPRPPARSSPPTDAGVRLEPDWLEQLGGAVCARTGARRGERLFRARPREPV